MTQGFLFEECPHPGVIVVPEKRGPHHAKKVCIKCRKFLGWVTSPENIEKQERNAEILTALAKLPQLDSWSREFVRTLGSQKHLSPKQQRKLDELRDIYLEKKNDRPGPRTA